MNTEKITRLEIINHAKNDKPIGRILTLYKELNDFDFLELELQDQGRTLKIFLSSKKKRIILKLWVVDKSIPLGERWDLFIKSELGIEEPYIIDFDCEMGKQYIEELEYKYSTHNTGDIVKWLDEGQYTEIQIIEFQEEVLEKFIKSFKFDR